MDMRSVDTWSVKVWGMTQAKRSTCRKLCGDGKGGDGPSKPPDLSYLAHPSAPLGLLCLSALGSVDPTPDRPTG